jgi:RIO-like serine/threonine protein kinase
VTPTELKQEQVVMRKQRRQSRPGPAPDVVKASMPKDDLENRILMAIIMLRRNMKSVSLIAIDERVRLPVEEVKRYAKLMKDAGLLDE